MTDLGSERIRDEAFLIARILLAVLSSYSAGASLLTIPEPSPT
jgi:hypothetical protein